MTMQNKLQVIQDHFEENPDAFYIAWRGTYPIDECFYRLNMVFVYVMFKLGDRILACKIAGTSYRKEGTKKIIFSNQLFRATNTRTKRKRVVVLNDLYSEEEAYPAGLSKDVVGGMLPYQISENREGDKALLDVLFEMVYEKDKLVTGHIIKPLTYLCAYEKEVYRPRTNGELIGHLKLSQKYKEEVSLEENFYTCFEDCFGKLSEGRWMVNFDWVIGKGIPYVDLSSLYSVYDYKGLIDNIEYEDSTFVFNLIYDKIGE